MGQTHRAVVLFSFLLVLFVIVPLSNGDDWPRWRGPNGDGISAETDWDPQALAQGPKISWRTTVGMGYSNVAIKDNRLYTMGRKSRENAVFCLNAETGKKLWQYSFESFSEPQATPAIDGESVYSLSYEGHLYCFNARKGKVQWYKHLVEEYKVVRPGYGFAGSPVVEGNLLIITGNSYGIALEKSNGKIVWTSPPCEGAFERPDQSGSEYATPVIYTAKDKRHALIFDTLGLHSIDVETGTPNWFHRWPSDKNPGWANATDPIFFDNKIFISTFGYTSVDVGCALLDIGSGKPKVLWQNKNMSNYFSTCVLMDGYLYGCHGDVNAGRGVLRCLDTKSGKIVWEKDFGKPLCLNAAGTELLILGENGVLYIAKASPQGYKEISRAQVFENKGPVKVKCWTPPILCNGRIYCRDGMGNLVCVDIKK
jgi:outer membrane protein assembly factor BamB